MNPIIRDIAKGLAALAACLLIISALAGLA